MELKQPTTYKEQLDKLRARGCQIDDDTFCLDVLRKINYYRFTAYFLPFKSIDDAYKEGTNFYQVYQIYEFDRQIRGVLFAVIEEIEIFLRAQLSYFHAHKYGAEGYLNPDNFNNKHNAEKFKELIAGAVKSRDKTLIVNHHLEKYEGHFPLWVITELFSFGMLSCFYSDLHTADQKFLARTLFHDSDKNIRSWLRCCVDLRNLCAHYDRLYYRKFVAVPATPKKLESPMGRSLFGYVLVLKFLYPDRGKWKSNILPRISSIIDEHEKDIELKHIGFPLDWYEKFDTK